MKEVIKIKEEPKNFKQLTQKELEELKESIKQAFIKKELYKGVSEVIKAVDTHLPFKEIYIAGLLDPSYEKAIKRSLIQTKTECNLIWIDKKYTTLVYEVIKEVDVRKPQIVRTHARRFFKCRAFLVLT